MRNMHTDGGCKGFTKDGVRPFRTLQKKNMAICLEQFYTQTA